MNYSKVGCLLKQTANVSSYHQNRKVLLFSNIEKRIQLNIEHFFG